MRQFKVSTTGTNVTIDDLHLTINHPTSDLDLLLQFTFTELIESENLKEAIDAGELTVIDENSNAITKFAETNTDTSLQDHIDNESNPHNLSSIDIPTSTSGENVQEALDAVTSSVLADLSGVHVRRTTSFTGSSTYVDVTFDATSLENDTSILQHNDTNTDNIDIKETGLYIVGYSTSILPTGLPSTLNARVRINDTTVIDQSETEVQEDTEITNFSEVFIVELTAGDFITLQIQTSVGTETVQAGTHMFAARLRGSKGDKGDKGDTGSGSTINLEENDVAVSGSPFDTLNFEGMEVSDAGSGKADIRNVYGSEFNLFESNAITVTTSTTPTTKISGNTTNLPIGKYRITICYGWSLDSTAEDFESQFTFDGTTFGINNGEGSNFIHTQEPQDSFGNNPDGRGTGQIYSFTKVIYVDVTVAGSKALSLTFNPDTAGIEASMWDANIEIVRVE